MAHVPGPRTPKTRKRDLKGRIPSEPLEQTIMVRLTQDVGMGLPAGTTVLLPIDAGRILIRRKVATVALAVSADVVLTEEEEEEEEEEEYETTAHVLDSFSQALGISVPLRMWQYRKATTFRTKQR